MAKEQQVTKESQQVTTKEPQRVTTKNPNKVEAGKRLAEYNHRKREELKAQKQKSEGPSRLSQYYSVESVLAVGVIGLVYYLYQAKKEEAKDVLEPRNPTVSQQLSSKVNKFEMD